jgi:hypothetical protein
MHERERREIEGAGPDAAARRVVAPEPPLLLLQRAAGNQAVAALIQRMTVQRGAPVRTEAEAVPIPEETAAVPSSSGAGPTPVGPSPRGEAAESAGAGGVGAGPEWARMPTGSVRERVADQRQRVHSLAAELMTGPAVHTDLAIASNRLVEVRASGGRAVTSRAASGMIGEAGRLLTGVRESYRVSHASLNAAAAQLDAAHGLSEEAGAGAERAPSLRPLEEVTGE